MEMMKKRIRVVGAAIVQGGRVLMAQRPLSEKAYKSLKWEFPGGKIEAGETEREAIVREIREELACDIEVDGLTAEMEHEYPDFVLLMTICICHLTEGAEPRCLEHNTLRWCTPDELTALDLAAADARYLHLVADHLKKL